MNRYRLCLLAVLMVVQLIAPSVPAQQKQVDVGAFTKEIMVLNFEGDEEHLVMWMPYEFFLAAGTSADAASRESIERELGFFKSYITFFIMGNKDKPDGTELYATEAEMRNRAFLKLGDGTEIKPLGTVPPKVAAIVAYMKTYLAQQGGTDRENMHIIVFPATTAQGKPIIDVGRKDVLNLQLKADAKFRAVSFTWRTPFDALTAVADCPRCKAGVSAKWTYCAYCGQKLTH